MSPGNVGVAMFNVSVMVAALLLVSYPIYRIICLWLDRALTSTEATISLVVLLFMVLGVMATWGTPLGILMILALVGICCGVPLLNHLADRQTLRRLEEQDLLEYRITIARQPGNAYARERLARIYLGRKQYVEALEQVDAMLERDAKDTKFKQLKERIETEHRRAVTRAKVCPKCFVENPPDASACLECGFRFVDPGDFLRMLLGEVGQQALRWAGLACGVLGLVLLLFGVAVLAAGLFFLFGIGCLMIYLYARLTNH